MPGNIISPLISNCTPEDFLLIKNYIAAFCLDDNDLRQEQFLVARFENKILGFGRLRTYKDSAELCSLGVAEPFRRRGIGSAISQALIKKNEKVLYTVTIIPGFFEKLGFKIVNDFPQEIKIKLDYCTTALAVPEPYVVMRLTT